MSKEILLYSGGMDSYIAWHYLNKPDTLYVILGHRYQHKETYAVRKTISMTKILLCLGMGKYEKADAEIPMRNLLLSMLGALEGADKIWMISQEDEMLSIPDRSERFFMESSDLISFLLGRRILIDTPFRTMDKTDMVAWYKKEGNSIEDLLCTIGCYSYENGYDHCGNCPACFRRWIALANNDILPGYDLSENIKDFYREKFVSYSRKRQGRMREWLF